VAELDQAIHDFQSYVTVKDVNAPGSNPVMGKIFSRIHKNDGVSVV
jgi:hypothetical protein